jgi:hypothetical protein
MPVLWLVDRGSPQESLAALPRQGPQNVIFYIEPNTDFATLAAQIGQRVRGPVRRVCIVAHGGSGRLNFSNGAVTEINVGVLEFLKGRARPAPLVASIEIHGCGVASGYLPPRRKSGLGNVVIANSGDVRGDPAGWSQPDVQAGQGAITAAIRASRGVQFLQRLADVCGVGVIGGIDYQVPDAHWRLEGPTITAFPGRPQRALLHDPENRFGLGETFLL